MRKPTVYYGGWEDSPLSVHTEISDLLTDFKSKMPVEEEAFFRCPSFLSWAKNKLVIKSAYDYSVQKDAISEESKVYAQWHKGEFMFFSDMSVKMTIYPPFLERTNIQGVVGEFDIGKWLRPTGPASTLIGGELHIKEGQPLMYVGFDKPVKLVKVIFPNDVEKLCKVSLSYPRKGRATPLVKLYDKFANSGLRRVVLNKIKTYNSIK